MNPSWQDILTIVGFAVGILGIYLSVYFYQKGREAREPRCFIHTVQDISRISPSSLTKIKILYGEQEVDRVFTSYIWFWNHGRRPILSADLPSNDTLELQFFDPNFQVRILDYRVVKVTRDEIEFKVNHDGSDALKLQFSFLDHRDGGIIEMQHTGSKDISVKIKGVIVGVRDGVKIIQPNKPEPTPKSPFLNRPIPLVNTNEWKSFWTMDGLPMKVLTTLIVLACVLFWGYTFSQYQRTDQKLQQQEIYYRELIQATLPSLGNADIDHLTSTLLEAYQIRLSDSQTSLIIVTVSLLGLLCLLLIGIWRYPYPYPRELHMVTREVAGQRTTTTVWDFFQRLLP